MRRVIAFLCVCRPGIDVKYPFMRPVYQLASFFAVEGYGSIAHMTHCFGKPERWIEAVARVCARHELTEPTVSRCVIAAVVLHVIVDG
jgi:hypothetical protein